MERIPVSGPWITDREVEYVADAARRAWYGDANLYHERFETAFAAYVGRRHAMAVPSCTSAIHLALLAHGVGPGDEVIVPDLTWIATSAPIEYVGATPVFADVDPLTWCLDPGSFEACITPRTRAVIPVDLYGGLPPMEAILAIAERHGIAVVEDAAEAVGAELGGRMAGSFGAASVFSFHGSKTLTTGEGGMLLTDDESLFRRCQVLRDHGRRPGDVMFQNDEVAYKYKMSALQAALGLAQTERVEELVARKREIFSWYAEELADDGLTLNHEPPGTRNAYWMVTALWEEGRGLDKTAVVEAMRARGVDCRPFFHPLSALPAYAASPSATEARNRNAVSYALSPRGINLPSALNLDRATVARACDTFRRVLEDPAVRRVAPGAR